ncbi:MAG: acetoacetate decarboxylase family protein [Deltaproteobacteria bacterium]|nr:acetoacetate decarboxylase family protein [Deltaproteobacteria bacterium]
MKFVRSADEIRKIMSTISNPKFDEIKMVGAMFLTTPEFVERVLPPPLKPAAAPMGTINIIEVDRSNVIGAFKGGAISISARYNDIEGAYCLTMPMDTDAAIIYGREIFGEPKKQAISKVTVNGDKVEGSVERQGIEVINIRGVIGAALDPVLLASSANFHYKYSINPDGSGLDSNPKLVHAVFTNTVRSVNACDVEVKLQGTPDDIYGDIPIEQIMGGMVAFLDMHPKVTYLAEVDKDVFLPYAFVKIDQYDRFSY